MKNRIIVLLTAWLICCAVQSFSAAIAEETRMDTYVLDQHGTVYAYLPQILKDGAPYPLVIALNCTTGDPQGEVTGNGWDTIAAEENIIVVAPTYKDYATWSENGYIKTVIDDAIERYPVDTRRIYATGFSNGGALSGALASVYPDLLAGISAMDQQRSIEGEKQVDAHIAAIKADISARKTYVQEAAAEEIDFYQHFTEWIRQTGPMYSFPLYQVMDNCVGCSTCARVCPKGCIRVDSGKPVYDYKHCANCMACIQACPTKAIQFATVKEPNPQARYRNLHIKLDEIIRANEQA